MKLAEIRKLVSGAQAGDRLVFYCECHCLGVPAINQPPLSLRSSIDAGHSTQHECKSMTEDDLLDEGSFLGSQLSSSGF